MNAALLYVNTAVFRISPASLHANTKVFGMSPAFPDTSTAAFEMNPVLWVQILCVAFIMDPTFLYEDDDDGTMSG